MASVSAPPPPPPAEAEPEKPRRGFGAIIPPWER
jgi:hypothetical protein